MNLILKNFQTRNTNHQRNYINSTTTNDTTIYLSQSQDREREVDAIQLKSDYFGEDPTYDAHSHAIPNVS